MSLDRRIDAVHLCLSRALEQHPQAAFASSFGVEDMVILDLIHRLDLTIEIFTLDTGRLHEETHALIARARTAYGRAVHVFHPDTEELETYVAAHGSNAFYDSLELRKRCCAIRKLGPLRRALQGKSLWITGLRRAQSPARSTTQELAFDAGNGLMKLNPLVDWSEAEVWAYVERHQVPVNALHRRGFPSIGCAPCTRAVHPGEDPRAGRWWWEQSGARECGLHVDTHGRLVRAHTTTTAG
ncbi:MAG: phosphoadenylyl-sulfate reductase [Burkholderiales bacterium]|nr:phosphoadenylyl-sulfate reductase [Burkholderiales bacterium]